jgi:uncharacterized protein
MTEVVPKSGRFQILSLDGGGIKGLFSAAVLAKLEEKLQIRIVDHFDLITGTSTGGLIAIGLGLGKRPKEIVEFYINHGPRIFGNLFGWRSFLHLFFRKYPQGRLESALRSNDGLGEKCLGESTKRLVIPTYNLGADKVRVFKTPHHNRLTTDWQIPAWQVALATSAAPTFFPACRHIEKTRLIDGGLWANNPAMVGIVEAVSMLGRTLDEIKIFSLGTTDTRRHRGKALDCCGFLRWLLPSKDVIDVLMRGQSVGVNGQVEHLIGKKRFFRIDPIVPHGIYALDKVSADDILAEAEDAALHFGPTFEKELKNHIAIPYKPEYSKTQN